MAAMNDAAAAYDAAPAPAGGLNALQGYRIFTCKE